MSWNRMSQVTPVTDAEARAVVGRLLVIESAQAAGLLVASPVGAAAEGVLLVASRQPREDGTLACVLVRMRVLGGDDAEQPGPIGSGEWLVVVDWETPDCSDEERVYLVSGADVAAREDWCNPGMRATPQRWASIFQVTPESSSG